jgi:transposase InsO family protein
MLSKTLLADGIEYEAMKDSSVAKNCGVCQLAKQPRVTFAASESRAKEVLELVHADLMGPMEKESNSGQLYALVLLDDHSRFSEVVCLTTKGQAAAACVTVLRCWQRATGKQVRCLRTDGGKEFAGELGRELRETGVLHQLSVPHTPQQNGRAERLNRTLVEKARAMLLEARMPKEFWAEALKAANFVRNVTYMEVIKDAPEFIFHGKRTDKQRLKVFGCLVYAHIPKKERKKWDAVSGKGVFGGYDTASKAWRILTLRDGEWFYHLSRDVKFIEEQPGYPILRCDEKIDASDEVVEIDLPNIVLQDSSANSSTGQHALHGAWSKTEPDS